MINKLIIQLGEDLKSKSDFVLAVISSSIFFALSLAFPIYNSFLKYKPGINDFSNHIMSAASASNLDIGARINSYLFLISGLLVVIIVIFSILYFLFNKYDTAEIDNNKITAFIRDTALIGIASIIASVLTTNTDFAVYLIVVALLLGWTFLLQKNNKNDFDMLIWSLITSAPFALFSFILFKRYEIFTKIFERFILKQTESSFIYNAIYSWLSISYILIAVLIWAVFAFAIYFIQYKVLNKFHSNINKHNVYKSALIISAIPFLFTGILQSFSLEILNIINKNYNIVFGRPRLLFAIIMLSATIISFTIFISLIKRQRVFVNSTNLVYTLYMPVSLIAMVCMIAQPLRMTGAGNEFFEMANHGLAVDQFFRFWKLPFIETFDPHMMSNQLLAYLYSFLNGYEPWAAFLYNNYGLFLYIIPMFYVLKKLIGSTNSFLIILCFPLLTNLFSPIFLLSGLIAICVIRMIKYYKTFDFYLFWIAALLLCIYRLDLGFASLMGGIAVYVITCFTFKEKIYIKKLIISGSIVFGNAILLFFLLCVIKDINPLYRLIEFIKLCMSNQSWAYSSVGNPDMLVYVIGYYILPLFVIISAILIVAKYAILSRYQDNLIVDRYKSVINKDAFIMFIFFATYFVFNVSRGIVRHSFAENIVLYILATIPLALVSLAVIHKNSNFNMLKFLVASLATIILINVNSQSYKGGGSSLISNALSSSSYSEQYTPSFAFNGTRVRGEKMPQDAKDLKIILDSVLAQSETYFDFASVNYFYALVGRKNPVYVNQSPLMICDDKTQEYALEQIQSNNPPICLVPIEGRSWSIIDGISVNYKYYLISEYIYQNYTPLIRLSGFDVYCLKEKKDSFIIELQNRGIIVDPIYSEYFNILDSKKLVYNQCSAQVDDNGNIILSPIGNDPYVYGFMGQIIEKIKKNNAKYTYDAKTSFKIDFISKSTGSVQLFYTLKEGEEFSQQNSEHFPITKLGNNTVILDLPSMPYDFRFDIDTSQEIILQHLTITQGLQTINNQPEIKVVDLGEIPRLWAEMDGNNAFLSAPLLQYPITNTTSHEIENEINTSFSGSMYLFLNLESQADGGARIDVSELSSVVGSINFKISKGLHSYVVRLGTDYYWWNSVNKKIQFFSSIPVDIYKEIFLPVNSSKEQDSRSEERILK